MKKLREIQRKYTYVFLIVYKTLRKGVTESFYVACFNTSQSVLPDTRVLQSINSSYYTLFNCLSQLYVTRKLILLKSTHKKKPEPKTVL